MKPILEHAIEYEGNQLALARALGVSPSVVTYWVTTNLPRARELQLIKRYGRKKRKEWSAG